VRRPDGGAGAGQPLERGVARAQDLLQAGIHGLSVGTSIIHLALQDTIAHFNFIYADFGYGTPNQEFRSTHKLQRRGKLLLCQRNGLTSLLFRLHGIQDRMNESLIGRVKASASG
jgi:hypothetical protein